MILMSTLAAAKYSIVEWRGLPSRSCRASPSRWQRTESRILLRDTVISQSGDLSATTSLQVRSYFYSMSCDFGAAILFGRRNIMSAHATTAAGRHNHTIPHHEVHPAYVLNPLLARCSSERLAAGCADSYDAPTGCC